MKKFKRVLSLLLISVFFLTGCKNLEDTNSDSIKNENKYNKEDEYISNTKESKFNILSMDVNTSDTIVLGNIMVDESLALKDKLNLILDEVSRLKFDNAPIKCLKIENNIAYIDIKEDKNKNYWSSKFFQGSTGASITSYTLVESLLQREYKGKWIDGIYFTYEGEKDVEFDHLDANFFGHIIKR